MRGLPGGLPETVTATVTGPLRSPSGRRSYLRGVLASDGTVTPVHGQGSHQLAALALANALIVVPEDVTEVESGSAVEVVRL